MNNVQKLKLNTVVSLINRFVILISGLLLPRLILVYYGSEVNGLVNSVTQFLSIITFLDLGVGSVVQSALYKPLVNRDNNEISRVLKAAKNYFRNISYILIIYIIILIFAYPIIEGSGVLDFGSTALLIIAISISQFSQYYFGITNEFLLNADQKGYIQLSTEILVVILNLIASIILIILGLPIYLVKLISSLIFLMRPFFLSYYVSKNYSLNRNIILESDPLPQKWNGMGQHIAYSIQNSTDIVVLTIFSTLSSVSIYSVYSQVTNAMTLIISAFTTGLQSFFGNLLESSSIDTINKYFSKIEFGLHNLVVFLYAVTAVLITPFSMLYTSGVTDVNYFQPIFAVVLVLSRSMFSLRTPYQSIVFAAGHFKQTQISSFIEAGLNIFLSIIFVNIFGITGVAFGSLLAMFYRTAYLSWYLSKNIVFRPISIFIKHIFVDGLAFLIILFMGNSILKLIIIDNFTNWIFSAVLIVLLASITLFFVNLIFYNQMFIQSLKNLFKKK